MGSLGCVYIYIYIYIYGFYKASIRYIDLLQGSYIGNYPPGNVQELCTLAQKI